MNRFPHPWMMGAAFGGHNPHMPHHPMDHSMGRGGRRIFEGFHRGRCDCPICEWMIESMRAVPGIEEIFEGLAHADPYRHDSIVDLYESIHCRYVMGYERGGEDSYHLSHDFDKLSRLMTAACRHNPWCGRGLSDLASRMKYFGGEAHISPRRLRYNMMPQPHFLNGRYFRDESWWK